jgi:putative ABC transport system permease protein
VNIRLVYLRRNLTRNPLRSALTCAAVALPIMIFVLSTAVIDGLERFLDNAARQLRLAITNKASVINPVPEGHRAKIESLDPTRSRLISVCGLRWIGGTIKNDPRLLSTVGCDADTFAATFPDMQLTPAEIELWKRDPRAIVLGRATAAQFGWKVGQRITIWPSVPPYTPMEFNVIAVAEHYDDPNTNWCRRDYIEEELKKVEMPSGLVSFYFVKCASRADLEHFARAVDEMFARSPDPTKSQDEKSFMNEFIAQQFNLPRNLTLLAAVTIFVAIMAAANTMSMNFRDRVNEFATVKSLGFGGGFALGLVQIESVLLCVLGGVFGALIPYIVFTHTPVGDITLPVIQSLEIHPVVCVQALLISLAIGLISGLWPAWAAARMKVVAALRSLE